MCRGRNECRLVTRAEFELLQQDEKQVVIIINDRVYNVTNFLLKHPGGELALLNCRGKDATVQFTMYHDESVSKYLKAYCIGQLEKPKQRTAIVNDYFELKERMKRMGLFTVQPSWEYWLMARICLLLAASVACSVLVQAPWLRVLSCAFFIGMFWQQLAFVGHDLGHTAVTHNRKKDFGFSASIGDALLGISIGWWKLNHNTHHLVTNSVVDDPDIQHMPLFAVTDELFESPFSSYYEDHKPFIRFIMRIQHLLFYPIMCVARFYLYAKSWEHLLGLNKPREQRELRLVEIASLVTFLVWYGALACQFPTWLHTVAFVLLCHAFAGLLHVQICISHFPMAICDYKKDLGTEESDDAGHFIRSQIQSTMDVDCAPSMDWFHGGLQFQVVHHLYPRIPRQHLRSAMPLVRDFCQRHQLEYVSLPFVSANVALYRRLADVAAKAKDWQPSGEAAAAAAAAARKQVKVE